MGCLSNIVVGGCGSRTIVLSRPTAARIRAQPTVVNVGNSMGPQGPKGEPGGTIPEIAFAYGDAAGPIWTAESNGILTFVRIDITAAFDDPAATINIGVTGDPGVAFPADALDPATLAEFERTADLRMVPGDALRITIAPGASTQGAGLIYLTFIPD